MKILHTSDWHLGRALFGRKRYEEFEAFLSWLAETIQHEGVDALLVAGDIFDTSTPSNRAQQLYYRFLCRIAVSSCRHVVVIAGNHDSPSFLSAPKDLLKALDVHVVGNISENLDDEILVLNDMDGMAELIVCAVPYLRDRDIRLAEAGESVEVKEKKMIEGIRDHYAKVFGLAQQKCIGLTATIPIVAMGHLFTAGGQTIEGDGVRELYIGSLAHVSASIFPSGLDYLALGHLHVPQKVNGSDVMRYSGSPLPMGFGEASQQKSVCMIEFTRNLKDLSKDIEEIEHVTTRLTETSSVRKTANAVTSLQLINIPVFQQLARIKGTWEEISTRISVLSATGSQAWLEIIYTGDEIISDLRERLDAAVSGSKLEILRVRNNRIIDRVLNRIHADETLDDLSINDVFERCLSANNVSLTQRAELLRAYQEAVASVQEDDTKAE